MAPMEGYVSLAYEGLVKISICMSDFFALRNVTAASHFALASFTVDESLSMSFVSSILITVTTSTYKEQRIHPYRKQRKCGLVKAP